MANIEREIKILDVNLLKLENKLKELNAEFIKSEYQINYIYDNKNLDLHNKDGYLRIRVSQSSSVKKTTLTYKEVLNSQDLRENLELNIDIENDQLGIMNELLEKLGYYKITTGHKDRIRYNYRNCIIDLDKWDKKTYPKTYIEIEFDNSSELDLKEIIKDLELEDKEITTKSIRDLKENY